MAKNIMAIDIGGSAIKFGLISDSYEVLKSTSIETPEIASTAEFYDWFCGNLPYLGQVDLIGVSSPGLITGDGDVLSYAAPKLKPLCNTNIPNEIAKRTGKTVAAINDGKAIGLCEIKLGAAKGAESAVVYAIGSGIAGCFCIDGKIFGGIDNFAGEFHFMSHIDEASGEVIKAGHLCGNFGLIGAYNRRASIPLKSGIEILNLYLNGDCLAGEIVEWWIRQIALHILSITVSLNPQLVCIGGGVTEQEWFVARIRMVYEQLCLDHFAGQRFLNTRIVACAFRNHANLIGAALNTKI